jgi:hypothetical protein
MTLTTFIALWGAVLSTILAWVEFRRNRPLTRVRYGDERGNPGMAEVLVENRGEVEIEVGPARVLVGKVENVIFTGDEPDTRTIAKDVVRSLYGQPRKLVRPGERCSVTFRQKDRGVCVALISWRRRSGLGAPTVPLVVRLRPEPR